MWNYPKRLDPFQKSLSSIAAIIVIASLIAKPAWFPWGTVIMFVIYFAGLAIYFSLPWPSWEWTTEQGRVGELKRLFKHAHRIILFAVLAAPLLCIGVSCVCHYFPKASDDALFLWCDDNTKVAALTNQLQVATGNSLPPSASSVVGINRGSTVILYPTEDLIAQALKPLITTMTKFATGMALLIAIVIVALLWLERLFKVLNEKDEKANGPATPDPLTKAAG